MSNAAFATLALLVSVTEASLAGATFVPRSVVARSIAHSSVAERSVTEGSAARRHLRLLRSFPAADTVLAASPDAVRLWLSESAELPSTRVTLASSGGSAIALAAARRAKAKGAPLEVALKAPLAPGRYTVSWRTMSKDGHVVKGTFDFAVQPAK